LALIFLFQSYSDHLDLHSFPTRLSSDLARPLPAIAARERVAGDALVPPDEHVPVDAAPAEPEARRRRKRVRGTPGSRRRGTDRLDRKSTRLNSSHVSISYAVFCLKKKNY